MELRIKLGESLVCEYSNEPCNALVKIAPDVERVSAATSVACESMWIGRSALRAALRMIDSMCPEASVNSEDPGAIAQHPVAQSTQPKQRMVVHKHVAREFEEALVELINNPPKVRDNEKEGLSELHVRELVKSYLPSIGDKMGLFQVLNNLLGMERERFDVMIEAVKNGRV